MLFHEMRVREFGGGRDGSVSLACTRMESGSTLCIRGHDCERAVNGGAPVTDGEMFALGSDGVGAMWKVADLGFEVSRDLEACMR